MAYEVPGLVYSLRSSGAIPLFGAVEVIAGGVVAVTGGAIAIDGVAQMEATAANPETIRIMKSGITFAVAAGVIDAGDEVEADANGEFIAIAAGVAVGKALTAAGAADEEFSLLLY